MSDLTLVKIQYRNHPTFIEAYEKYHANPQNEELRKKMELESKRVLMSAEEFKRYQEYEKNINN